LRLLSAPLCSLLVTSRPAQRGPREAQGERALMRFPNVHAEHARLVTFWLILIVMAAASAVHAIVG